MTNFLLRSALAASTAVISTASASAAAQVRSFDVAAQSAVDGIALLGKQADIQIISIRKDTRDKRTNAVRGNMDIDQALGALLSGTGLSARKMGARTYSVYRLHKTSALVSKAPLAVARDRVQAQETASSAVDSALASAEVGQREADAEIVVTARRRSERVDDVPMSITAISGQDIAQRGLLGSADALRGIPGVNQMEHSAGQSITIRGIESATTGQNFGSGPTTATYFGEVETTSAAGLYGGAGVDLKLVDIQRIEVLRGPQGTSFGNASMGGAVRTIPNAPLLAEIEGRVAGSLSSMSRNGDINYVLQGMINIPVVMDRFAIRAVAYDYEDSGFVDNRAASDPAFIASAIIPFGAQASAADEDHLGGTHVTGGRIAALFQPIDDLRFTATYITQKTETDGIALSTRPGYVQAILDIAPEHGGGPAFFDTKIDIFTATMEYHIDWGQLVATYSHVDSKSISAIPLSAYLTPWPLSQYFNSDHSEDVGEIRFVSSLEGPINFIAGLYHGDVTDNAFADNRWHGNVTMENAIGVVPGPRGVTDAGVYTEERDLTQKAAYGELSFEPVDGLTLTGGVRHYTYDRDFLLDAVGGFYSAAGQFSQEKGGASGETYRLNAAYKPRDNVLLYADFSQGFRLGRLQAGLPAGVCDLDNDGIYDGDGVTSIASTRRLESDSVDNYEIGGKFALFDRKVHVSADVYRAEWKGIPVRVRTPALSGPCGGGFGYFANAGAAVSEGFEFALTWQVSDATRIDLGGSLTDAKLTEDVPAIGAESGDRLPGAPKYNANAGILHKYTLAGYDASLRVDAIYVGAFYGDLAQSANTRAGDYIKLDFNAGIEFGNLGVDIFVRNITNEDAFTYRGDSAAADAVYGYRLRPRTIGVQMNYRF
ncbi:TonB-dependent receptor [Sphingosinicella rhizophila]|uniref:TonB-dependent receptor n=1 Tax=Sphingosinicella rhizophila TaxID=3050082 RepID=A0ABU3Q4M2_9SPHN|nr:TonB-dependent receptor [Sphingosinicella sp. GR2756]MDT9598346.1 TonB-dependent receptor [Sphingosinicella sp. GR2756]